MSQGVRTVAVTGAGGFVGRHVCRALVERGFNVRALLHSPGKRQYLPAAVEAVTGDVFDERALDDLLGPADACVHLIGIIEERPKQGITFQRLHVDATRAVLDAQQRHGVERHVQMSALGTRPNAVASYHRTKFEAEELVRESGARWTIFRPSVIHGPDGGFIEMVVAWARGRKAPFVFLPYFGSGLLGTGPRRQLQPVFIEDVAAAFGESLVRPEAVGEIYPIGGATRLTWPEMFATIRDAVPGAGRWRPVVPIPAWYARGVARAMTFAGMGELLPFNADQVIMSQEDSVCDNAKVVDQLGIEPMPFEESLALYAGRL